MSEKIIRIPSRLYRALYEVGGDKLIAAYCILKKEKGHLGYLAYKSKNNKIVSHIGLLRKQTTLSHSTLTKIIPQLINLGVCSFNEQGDFIMVGNNKLKIMFNDKLVPIFTTNNIIDTTYNSLAVRIHSDIRQQKTQIAVKTKQRDLQLLFLCPEKSISLKDLKEAKRINKKTGGKLVVVTPSPILGKGGYGVLKNGIENVNTGGYVKRNLIKRKIISAPKRFEKIRKMDFNEYVLFKKFDNTPNLCYHNNHLCKRLISHIVYNNIYSI